MTISPTVDQEAQINQEIIKTLRGFLSTKNKSNYENTYWSSDDFDTYWFPYQDIYRIEDKDSISNFYQPTLLHIVDTDKENKKLIKVAYIGHNTVTEENTLKYIYNILATKSDSGVVLSNSTQYFTKDWKKIEKGSLSYVISPNKEFNEQEAEKQIKDIEKISDFFNTEPLPITYYSCTNLKELFQIKGFDYNPIMYREGGGGLSARQNIVFSANSSEFYTHEIMHLYIIAFYYSRAQLFNEGMATYFGGSRKYSYTWHKKKLKNIPYKKP
ncbi:hypothetical protein QYS48_06810 [Marivirga arenosa]|uniref:Uncharacterized protein n=1 Tax=Marivirga arenosa TaxID=3059076 RepID=A0AA49GFH8_9BACT|nr:hypothetical protein [Marivirga sp. ABR2-2]WKK86615.2 hypothetical protein QYS48_06810 [Marivirga sp. ABR2-2]